MIEDTTGMLDDSIAAKKQKKVDDGILSAQFIEGFLSYLDTRDKKLLLKENVRKAKEKLREDPEGLFYITKNDQLVQIIEKIEKNEFNLLMDTSRHLQSMAFESKGDRHGGEFVKFVDELCSGEPTMDKQVARTFINQIFEGVNEKNL